MVDLGPIDRKGVKDVVHANIECVGTELLDFACNPVAVLHNDDIGLLTGLEPGHSQSNCKQQNNLSKGHGRSCKGGCGERSKFTPACSTATMSGEANTNFGGSRATHKNISRRTTTCGPVLQIGSLMLYSTDSQTGPKIRLARASQTTSHF